MTSRASKMWEGEFNVNFDVSSVSTAESNYFNFYEDEISFRRHYNMITSIFIRSSHDCIPFQRQCWNMCTISAPVVWAQITAYKTCRDQPREADGQTWTLTCTVSTSFMSCRLLWSVDVGSCWTFDINPSLSCGTPVTGEPLLQLQEPYERHESSSYCSPLVTEDLQW